MDRQVLGFGSGNVPEPFQLEYLVIAGGGGGANRGYVSGGGGGAGGFRTASSFDVATRNNYTVTVGAGGGHTAVGNNSVFHSINICWWWTRFL